MGLCQAYEAAFAEHGLRTAQILLTTKTWPTATAT